MYMIADCHCLVQSGHVHAGDCGAFNLNAKAWAVYSKRVLLVLIQGDMSMDLDREESCEQVLMSYIHAVGWVLTFG